MITIVFSHPYQESFNASILSSITSLFNKLGREYQVIDLYSDGFNPAMTLKELSMYHSGQTDDPLVKRYEKMITESEHVIFMFPVWWGMMPAMLKGFIDKVFLKGIVYDTTPEGGLIPNLDIERTTVITTSENDTEVFASFMEGYFIPLVLNTVGMNNVKWHNCDNVKSGSDAHRKMFVDEVLDDLAK